ncbi:cyd operon protein YbgE [Edwardsiella piscicida]|uniref:cyd operon protein YbgE n=1 Tax=Edwardsiella piscicida TaxID=1263550 RepID=UPI00084BE3A8|nr:cyd operon protein YbgE [Edwardsiella piscicida]EKS7766484.1 cyd operon protein YbgE [Edwardsiella piscicida]EKS7793171.1 cyd operon protein YbgE [Edwardsiella piscicida]EKS7812889.1 cyd operon protein YbgE [Edwardsiella piscicida]ELM3728745.1 cyd operon protein YbgE [Edwardsiella piscicida]ELV7534970.1 cyd operon protein YbgE [Edwardsiella piscicida]
MTGLADRLYRLMDKGPLRALSLILALALAGCIFWDPTRFAAKTSSLAIWQGLLLMWAVCSGVVHGVGFCPRRLRWRAFFSPLPALIILIAGLLFFFR